MSTITHSVIDRLNTAADTTAVLPAKRPEHPDSRISMDPSGPEWNLIMHVRDRAHYSHACPLCLSHEREEDLKVVIAQVDRGTFL